MSRLKRDIRGKKLRNLLARADDEVFLQMLWQLEGQLQMETMIRERIKAA